MSNKLVWSDNSMLNSLLALSEEDLKAELIDYGYSEEFISDMSLDELHNILYEEETLWEMDIEDFENNVVPMINRQTDNGIVLMVGEVARWDGNRGAGKAVFTEDLKGGDIDPDVTSVEIYDDGSGLVWLGHHHDGTHKFRLYALPEENQVEFIEDCMEDAIEDMYNWYYGEDDLGDVRDEIIEDILAQLTDLNFLNENVNFSQVPNYCKPIKNLLNESLNESKDDIATITVDAVLEDDIDLEDIRAFDIEPKYSWNKTFDNLTLTGTKENIVRYLKSGLYNADDEWIKEYYPELLEEELNEASTKNPKKLAKELKEIKKLANDYGFEYFTAMPFTSYDSDPISIEYNYPEFFRIVKAFWKEMETLDDDTKEKYIEYADPEGKKKISKDDVNLNNPDVLDYLWDLEDQLAVENKSDFDHDFETIVKTCELILERGTPIQFEKIFKNNFNSGLDDNQILADRERQAALAAEYNESLNEDINIGTLNARKFIKEIKEKNDDTLYYKKRLKDGKPFIEISTFLGNWAECIFENDGSIVYEDDITNNEYENGEVDNKYIVYKNYNEFIKEMRRGWLNFTGEEYNESLINNGQFKYSEWYVLVKLEPTKYLKNHGIKDLYSVEEVVESKDDDPNPNNGILYTWGRTSHDLERYYRGHTKNYLFPHLCDHNIDGSDIVEMSKDKDYLINKANDLNIAQLNVDESLNEEKKTYMCDDCGYEVELDDKEYTGQCPNCGENHGFYELNESANTKHLVDKFVKYVDENGTNDINVTKLEREINGYLVELERDGIGGTFNANCKFKDNGDILYLDTEIIDEDDNWDDRVKHVGGVNWALKEANDKDYIKFNDYDSFISYITDMEVIDNGYVDPNEKFYDAEVIFTKNYHMTDINMTKDDKDYYKNYFLELGITLNDDNSLDIPAGYKTHINTLTRNKHGDVSRLYLPYKLSLEFDPVKLKKDGIIITGINESLKEDSNNLIDKIEDNLIDEGFEKVQDVLSYRRRSFGGEDVYSREGNIIEFLTNSQMGYAYCKLNFDNNTFTYSDNWDGEDIMKEVFTDIKDLGHLISERSFYNYNIIPLNLEESLNENDLKPTKTLKTHRDEYIVVKGVKVPKVYFDNNPGLSSFEVRDLFLADEEEEDAYMHADDLED